MNPDQVKQRMEGAVDALRKEFGGLRTGRASANLLDNVHVDAYGASMPLNQVGTVAVPEPRLITVQVWDAGLAKSVEKGIRDAGLGLNPQPDGSLIRVPLPELSQERRLELAKIAGKYAEAGRIAVRNVRRDAIDEIKKQKGGSEDEQKAQTEKVQKLTDETIKKIDELLASKEKEISHV